MYIVEIPILRILRTSKIGVPCLNFEGHFLNLIALP